MQPGDASPWLLSMLLHRGGVPCMLLEPPSKHALCTPACLLVGLLVAFSTQLSHCAACAMHAAVGTFMLVSGACPACDTRLLVLWHMDFGVGGLGAGLLGLSDLLVVVYGGSRLSCFDLSPAYREVRGNLACICMM
jgi:hypothetical protein